MLEETTKSLFLNTWKLVAAEVHDIAKSKGFWDTPRNFGEMIALIHSELSECLEANRTGKTESDHLTYANAIEEELADVVIRIMDMATGLGLQIGSATLEKLEYNKTRFLNMEKIFRKIK